MGHMIHTEIVAGENPVEAVRDAVKLNRIMPGSYSHGDVVQYPAARRAGITRVEAGLIANIIVESDGSVVTAPVLDESTLGEETVVTVPNDDPYGSAENVVEDFWAGSRWSEVAVTGFISDGDNVLITTRKITPDSAAKSGHWWAMYGIHI